VVIFCKPALQRISSEYRSRGFWCPILWSINSSCQKLRTKGRTCGRFALDVWFSVLKVNSRSQKTAKRDKTAFQNKTFHWYTQTIVMLERCIVWLFRHRAYKRELRVFDDNGTNLDEVRILWIFISAERSSVQIFAPHDVSRLDVASIANWNSQKKHQILTVLRSESIAWKNT